MEGFFECGYGGDISAHFVFLYHNCYITRVKKATFEPNQTPLSLVIYTKNRPAYKTPTGSERKAS